MRHFKNRAVILALSNIFPAAVIMFLAQVNFYRFLKAGNEFRVSHLLLVIQLVLIAFFFIARYAPKTVSHSPWDILISTLGTFAPFFFSLVDRGRSSPIGVTIQIIGNCLSIYAVFSLNRAIGILPANRGIQTAGMFRFVRHPLYASYQVSNLGYILSHPSYYNIGVALIGFFSQVLRIYSEERLLSQDPDYVKFKSRVRWRMIPFMF